MPKQKLNKPDILTKEEMEEFVDIFLKILDTDRLRYRELIIKLLDIIDYYQAENATE